MSDKYRIVMVDDAIEIERASDSPRMDIYEARAFAHRLLRVTDAIEPKRSVEEIMAETRKPKSSIVWGKPDEAFREPEPPVVQVQTLVEPPVPIAGPQKRTAAKKLTYRRSAASAEMVNETRALLKWLEQHGYALASVARRAGVSTSAVYHYLNPIPRPGKTIADIVYNEDYTIAVRTAAREMKRTHPKENA